MFGLFKRGSKTTITAVNIRLHGRTHKLDGLESNSDRIELSVPFKNKTHTDLLTESGYFKAEKRKPLKIDAIKIAAPFAPISMDPKPPLVIEPDQTVNFKIVVLAPSYSYTGPVDISFESASEEVVHLELTKTLLSWKGKRVEIESSSRMLNLQKNGIFVEKIQLYKALSYGDTVSKLEVGFPFKIVNTDPKLPAKLDTPNGYLLSLYIQAPTHHYSGVLEITLS